MKQPNTSRVPTVNPTSTPMIKMTITRITSTVVLTEEFVDDKFVDGEFVDEPE